MPSLSDRWEPLAAPGTFTSHVFHVTTKSEGRLVLSSAFKKPASGKVCKETLVQSAQLWVWVWLSILQFTRAHTTP